MSQLSFISSAPTQLRDYQAEDHDACLDIWKESPSEKILLVHSVGLGKTVLFGAITYSMAARHPDKRILILAHRDELIDQAGAKLKKFYGMEYEIEKAQKYATRNKTSIYDPPQVVIGSIQTMNTGPKCEPCWEAAEQHFEDWKAENPDAPTKERLRNGKPEIIYPDYPGHPVGCDDCSEGRLRRLLDFDPSDFSLVIIDEAHRSMAKTYRRVIRYFGDVPLLGVTGTPDRHDEEALGQVYQTILPPREIDWAVREGWLVPPRLRPVKVEGLDFSKVRTLAGDLADKDMNQVYQSLDDEGMLHMLVEPVDEALRKLGGKAVHFFSGVEVSKRCADIVNRGDDFSAIHIDGSTDKDDRKQLLKAYYAGEHQYFCNVGIATEGWDDPSCNICAPKLTKSRALFAQMIGRVLRPLESIVPALNAASSAAERRRIIKESEKPYAVIIDIVGNSGRHQLVSAIDIMAGNHSGEVIALAKEFADEADKSVDAMEALELALQQRREEEEAARKAELANRLKVRCGVKYSARWVDPFQVFEIDPNAGVAERGWDRKPATPNQKNALIKLGVEDSLVKSMTNKEASAVLNELGRRKNQGLCTLKQAKLLQQNNFDPDVSFEEASEIIDKLIKSGFTLRGNYEEGRF